MKVMILAAGVGERMRPLTDHTPKPLLMAGGKPLLQWHVENLVAAGFQDLVINVSHLGAQVMDFLGDGGRFNCQVHFSQEVEPLETAGGIVQALPLLGEEPFAVLNADIWCDYPLAELRETVREALQGGQHLAHLVFVDNPPQHGRGDFVLGEGGVVSLADDSGSEALTYSGIAAFHPRFFAGIGAGKLPLRPILDSAIARGVVSGEHYRGAWVDVGTPQRLQELDARLGLP